MTFSFIFSIAEYQMLKKYMFLEKMLNVHILDHSSSHALTSWLGLQVY